MNRTILGLSLILLFLLFGCGANQGAALGGQESGVVFTLYPPMPAVNEQLAVSSEQIRGTETLNLSKGWSTISFPADRVISTGSFAYALQYYQDGQYVPINPASGLSSELCQKGFWAMTNSASPVTINASDQEGPGSLTLQAGWNLIAFPLKTAKNFSDLSLTYNGETKALSQAASLSTSPSSAWLYGLIQYYKSNRWYQLKSDNSANQLQPWKGYWVFCWQNGTRLNFLPPPVGNQPWSRKWGSRGADQPVTMAFDRQGNILMAGMYADSGADIFLIKYSPAGNLLAARSWSSDTEFSNDYVNDMAVDGNGNVYLTGFLSNVDGDKILLLKYADSNGSLTPAWQKTWCPEGDAAYGTGVAIDADNNVCVTGGAYQPDGQMDVVVLKYSPQGTLLAQKKWGGSLSEYPTAGIKIAPDGSIYVCGYSKSNVYAAPLNFLLKLNPDLSFAWSKTVHLTMGDQDLISGLELDSAGNIYLCGSGPLLNHEYRFYVVKINPAGGLDARVSWGPGVNYFSSACIQGDNLYLLGDGILPGEAYIGGTILLKYSLPDLVLQEQKVFSGAGWPYSRKLLVDAQGNRYLAIQNDQPGGGWQEMTSGPDYYWAMLVYDAGLTYQDTSGTDATVSAIEDLNPPAPGEDQDAVLVKAPAAMPPVTATIDSIEPASAAWGDTVTITGSGFGAVQGENQVSFCGNVCGAALYWSDNRIIVRVAGGTYQTAVFLCLNYQLFTFTGFSYKAPQINQLIPTAARAGDTVTVQGENFGTPGNLQIDGIDARVNSWSPTEIEFVVPEGIMRHDASLVINLSNRQWTSSAFFLAPYIDYLNAPVSPAGSTVTISGLGFGEPGSGTVELGSQSAEIAAWSDTEIDFIVPALPEGDYPLTVTTEAGDSNSDYTFTLTPAPYIDYIFPTMGGATAGSVATVYGSGFTQDQGQVYLGETPCDIASWSDGIIEFYIPQDAPQGVSEVTVDIRGVQVQGEIDVWGVMTLEGISPAFGGINSKVTVTGSNFPDETLVFFNGVQATSYQNWGEERDEIVCWVPPYASTGPVTVQNYIGITAGGVDFQVIGPKYVSSGYWHHLAVKLDGTVKAWGWDNRGQLGDGTFNNSNTPVAVSGLSDIVEVQAGAWFSLARKNNGSVWAWGGNEKGQLGQGDYTDRNSPVQVLADSALQLAAGDQHALAYLNNCKLYAWGAGDNGQIGNGEWADQTAPVELPGYWWKMAAGGYHNLALGQDGRVYSWGLNDQGQLGIGNYDSKNTPTQIPGLTEIVELGAGRYSSYAIDRYGALYSWGWNNYGQLGTGTVGGNCATPARVTSIGPNPVSAVAGGAFFVTALTSDGSVWAWGRSEFGEYGNGTTDLSSIPVLIPGMEGPAGIGAGKGESRIVINNDASVWNWGIDYYGNLGNGAGYEGLFYATPLQPLGF